MRAWVMVVMVATGCVTPRIGVDRLAAEAGRNVVAAARFAAQKQVELEGNVETIAFLTEEQTVTSGRASATVAYGVGRSSSSSRTRNVIVQQPYALVTTQEEPWVTCFLSAGAPVDALEKGLWASMVGTFNSFQRVDDRLRVVLTNCRVVRVSERQPTPR